MVKMEAMAELVGPPPMKDVTGLSQNLKVVGAIIPVNLELLLTMERLVKMEAKEVMLEWVVLLENQESVVKFN